MKVNFKYLMKYLMKYFMNKFMKYLKGLNALAEKVTDVETLPRTSLSDV